MTGHPIAQIRNPPLMDESPTSRMNAEQPEEQLEAHPNVPVITDLIRPRLIIRLPAKRKASDAPEDNGRQSKRARGSRSTQLASDTQSAGNHRPLTRSLSKRQAALESQARASGNHMTRSRSKKLEQASQGASGSRPTRAQPAASNDRAVPDSGSRSRKRKQAEPGARYADEDVPLIGKRNKIRR